MKKLILLAGVFAIGGAFGACTYLEKPDPKTVSDGAWAYKWKFTGKTTKGVKSNCSPNYPVTRTSASLKIQGWSLYCEPQCDDFESAEADEYFWQSKPKKLVFDTGSGVTFEIGNIIGKSGKNYEAMGTATFIRDSETMYGLTFAGLGKFDQKKKRVKSVSGNFAGWAVAPYKDGKNDCGGDKTKVWECCGCPTLEANSVAYGKWSVKYNKSLSKKYANGTIKSKHIWPKWARK